MTVVVRPSARTARTGLSLPPQANGAKLALASLLEQASNFRRTSMTTATATKTAIPTGTWAVDPAHSSVGFQVKHMGIATVRGHFAEFGGTLEIGEDPSSIRAWHRRGRFGEHERRRAGHAPALGRLLRRRAVPPDQL